MPIQEVLNKGLQASVVGRLFPDFDKFAVNHPWVGQKIGDIQAVNGVYFQEFQNATAYARLVATPFEVHGAIREKYLALGGPTGFLGVPVTDETGTPDGEGRFNHFENGSIYWHPAIGAFEVHGAIRDKWASLGWEAFGYPLTDESGTPDGIGRFNHFRSFFPNGTQADASIYWTPDLGAHEVHGAIRATWSAMGWETSFLGYPVSDEYFSNGWRVSDFQNGSIAWNTSGTQVRPQQVVVNAPSITFGTGIAVGGFGTLTVFSDGTTHFHGHLHASGWPSYDCLAVFTVKDTDGRGYAASHSGRVHGTDEPGSRDLDWDDWGTNDDIRRNWPKIRDAGTGGYKVDVTSDWSPQKIAEDVIAVIGVVLSVIPLLFTGGGSSKSSDPNYGPPDAYPPGGLPSSSDGGM